LYLRGGTKFSGNPFASANLNLFGCSCARGRAVSTGLGHHVFGALGDVSDRPEAGLNLDVRAFDNAIGSRADGQQVDLVNTVLQAANGKVQIPVEPFLYETFSE
jgi:hypothetical protein